MYLSTRAIVISFIAGFLIAWAVGETIGGWPGQLTEIGIMLAIGAVLCFAYRDDH